MSLTECATLQMDALICLRLPIRPPSQCQRKKAVWAARLPPIDSIRDITANEKNYLKNQPDLNSL